MHAGRHQLSLGILTVFVRKLREREADLISLGRKVGLSFDPDRPLGEDEEAIRSQKRQFVKPFVAGVCSVAA